MIGSLSVDWHRVTGRTFASFKPSKAEPGRRSVMVTYSTGTSSAKEWVCCEHVGYAKSRADKFWYRHGGGSPPPTSIDEFLDRVDELRPIAEILIELGGKYPYILDHRAAA